MDNYKEMLSSDIAGPLHRRTHNSCDSVPNIMRKMCKQGIMVGVEVTVTAEGGDEGGRQRPESLSRTVRTEKEVQNSGSRST